MPRVSPGRASEAPGAEQMGFEGLCPLHPGPSSPTALSPGEVSWSPTQRARRTGVSAEPRPRGLKESGALPRHSPDPQALPKRFGGRWCPPAATRGSACEFALPREGKGALFPLRGAVGPGPPTVDSAHTRDFGFAPPRSEPNQ